MSAPFKFWMSLLVALTAFIVGLHYMTEGPEPAGQAATAPAPGAVDDTPERVLKEETPLKPSDRSQAWREDAQPETLWPASSPPEPVVPAESSTRDSGRITVREAAGRLTANLPVVVIFFSTTCPRSRAAFPSFVRLAQSVTGRYNVLAFATDDHASDVSNFLYRNGASFSAEVLEPWEAGDFSRAMDTIGLRVGSTWMLPLIAVIDADGRVLGQWQGLTNVSPLQPVLKANIR